MGIKELGTKIKTALNSPRAKSIGRGIKTAASKTSDLLFTPGGKGNGGGHNPDVKKGMLIRNKRGELVENKEYKKQPKTKVVYVREREAPASPFASDFSGGGGFSSGGGFGGSNPFASDIDHVPGMRRHKKR